MIRLALPLVLAGCVHASSAGTEASSPVLLFPGDRAASVLAPGSWSEERGAFSKPHRELVTSRERWQFLAEAYDAKPVSPLLDFRNETVIFAAYGISGASGPYILVDSVFAHADTLVAVVRTGGCDGPIFGGMIIAAPVQAVRVPGRWSQIRYVERFERIRDCMPRKRSPAR